jgi:hypothetical protein
MPTLEDLGFDAYGNRPMGQGSSLTSATKLDDLIENLSGSKLNVGVISSTDGRVTFDLENRRIIINDGTNDRILLGYQEGGF